MNENSAPPSRSYEGVRFRTGWIEALAVAALLVGLAWVAQPQTSDAADFERSAALRDNLHFLRTQIMVYRAQHNGNYPGYPNGDMSQAPTVEAFIVQMSHYSDTAGNTSATPSDRFPLGPYLHEIPVNPLNGNAGIALVGQASSLPSPNGWLYDPAAGRLLANLSGQDAQGRAYRDY